MGYKFYRYILLSRELRKLSCPNIKNARAEWVYKLYNMKGQANKGSRNWCLTSNARSVFVAVCWDELETLWHHLITLQVLCSFVACLPTTLGISCYSCAEYPGSSETCSSLSMISCDSFYDSCMTTIVTGEVHGYQYSTTVKDCSISNTCDSNLICNQVNSSISQSNGTMFSCSVNCCDSDLCNGGGELVQCLHNFNIIVFNSVIDPANYT